MLKNAERGVLCFLKLQAFLTIQVGLLKNTLGRISRHENFTKT